MVRIRLENGRCKELSAGGVSLLSGCSKIEFEAAAHGVPTLKLTYPIVDAEIEISDDIRISKEYEVISTQRIGDKV